MAPERRKDASCWTCRLRRKSCDSVRPVCGSCQHLEIPCYSGVAKPPWMDGEARQKHMSETIKARIKQKALLRRARRLPTQEDQGVILDLAEAELLSPPSTVPTSESRAISETRQSIDLVAAFNQTSPDDRMPDWASVDRTENSPSSSAAAPPTAGVAFPIPMRFGSIMIYLDYVFPFLFPFYQPSLVETGRQWLLGLLCQNEVSFHLAASLSAYFFALVTYTDQEDAHGDCKALVRGQLVEQMDVAVRSIQGTVSAVQRRGAQSSLLDKARTMEEITQLLVVEATAKRDADWKIHLAPALALFDEIFKTHGIHHSQPSLPTLLNTLSPMTTPHHKSLPYTADQSALVFFVSLLLFIDIVASTSCGAAPNLHAYYHNLLTPNGNEECPVRLETIVGCQNWALVAVGNISALCAWKREATQQGGFSILRFVGLAGPISRAIDEGLRSLDVFRTSSGSDKRSDSWLAGYYTQRNGAMDRSSIANVTRIWAHAAEIYLSVSLSGWQPHSTDIQSSVIKVLRLLQTIESPGLLQSLSWPMTVAGCLALPHQEPDFRRIVSGLGQLGDFGTAGNAMRVMEAVWSSRDNIDGSVWDMASSLNILGTSTLLI